MSGMLKSVMSIAMVALTMGCQRPAATSSHSTIAPPASKDLAAMEWVTGFHSHFIKGTGFEFRLLEVDGSATVAMNPIYLYLVVTNNSSGGNEQTRLVRLPQVSAIERVRFHKDEPRLEVEVRLDHWNDDVGPSIQKPATLVVTASIAEGKLGDIHVAIQEH